MTSPEQIDSLQLVELAQIVADFALGLHAADALSLRATNRRSGRLFQAGLGPHSEDEAVRLILREMSSLSQAYLDARPTPYPSSRLRCDVGIGNPMVWAIEVKMARAFHDNGSPDDTYLKDLLSPYEQDRSALTDAAKLRRSGFRCRRALLVYGFDYADRPLEPLLRELEVLLRLDGALGQRASSDFGGLVHPLHERGCVCAWEILDAVSDSRAETERIGHRSTLPTAAGGEPTAPSGSYPQPADNIE
jgi:hypothetical protein